MRGYFFTAPLDFKITGASVEGASGDSYVGIVTYEGELNNYPNTRNLFAFPFGQPISTYSKDQIQLIKKNGAQFVFSSYPLVNSNISSSYLHRIPLDSTNNTKAKIWFNILRRSLKL